MKRNKHLIIGFRAFFIFLFLLCFCIIEIEVQEQSVLADAALGDLNRPIDYGSTSPFRPQTQSETYFYTDTGGDLDKYLYRDNLTATAGRLIFNIDISRYYSPLIANYVDPVSGLLPTTAIEDLVERKLLPQFATLTLQVFDVDHNEEICSEIDHIYINGNQFIDPWLGGEPAKLGSGNDQWYIWQRLLPIGYLKFPLQPGQNGQKPSALNEIAIDVNTQCNNINWAVKVDWGAITIPNPQRRPIVFVHGWRGSTRTFEEFDGFALQDGIPTERNKIDLARGLRPIVGTAEMLVEDLDEVLTQFGVDKVNLFAHSKGGIVSRYALRNPAVARHVANLATFGTPHHGNDFVLVAASKDCPSEEGLNVARCFLTAFELTEAAMRIDFNYSGCTSWSGFIYTNCSPRWVQAKGVNYFSLVGRFLAGMSEGKQQHILGVLTVFLFLVSRMLTAHSL